MIPTLLVCLAILDAGFAGFRAAAGRDGRIRKRPYYQRAVARGALTGLLLVVALATATGLALVGVDDPSRLYAELCAIGERMLVLLLAYSALVLAALTLYGIPRLEIRILATVTVLGPLTLLRPWLVVAATIFGLCNGGSWPAILLTVVASGCVLCLEKWLSAQYARR